MRQELVPKNKKNREIRGIESVYFLVVRQARTYHLPKYFISWGCLQSLSYYVL